MPRRCTALARLTAGQSADVLTSAGVWSSEEGVLGVWGVWGGLGGLVDLVGLSDVGGSAWELARDP